MYGARRLLLVPGRFTPRQLPGCVLWLPADGVVQSDGASQFTTANSEYLSKADNASLSTGDIDFTIAVWVRMDTLPGFNGLVTKWNSNAQDNREYALEYVGGGTNRFDFVVSKDGLADASQQTVVANTFGAVSTNTWYLLIASHDAANDQIAISVNAGAEDTAAWANGVYDGAAAFAIGAYANPTGYHDGRAALVGFWKRILTADERTALYAGGAGLAYSQLPTALKTSLVSYWHLDEPSGTRVDSHGDNDLTDNNTVTAAVGPNTHAAGDGAAVSQWTDQGGQGNNVTQATAASRPIYKASIVNGRPVTRYDNTDDKLVTAAFGAALSQPFTVFLVAKRASVGGIDTVFDGLANTVVIGGDATPNYVLNAGSSQVAGTSDTSWHIWTAEFGATDALRIDGTGVISADAGANTLDGVTLGTTAGSTNPLDGDIAEVIIYNRALSASERTRVEQYLGRKYNVAVT